MSEIVVGSWVGMKGAVPLREGRVGEVQRRTGEPYALDEVRVVMADGTAYTATRGSLMLVDEPVAELPRLAPLIEDEIARLTRELESERRARTAASQSLDHERQVAYNALADAQAQAKRADMWQAATTDALAQVALWRVKYEDEHQECVRMHERLSDATALVVELMQSKEVRDGE